PAAGQRDHQHERLLGALLVGARRALARALDEPRGARLRGPPSRRALTVWRACRRPGSDAPPALRGTARPPNLRQRAAFRRVRALASWGAYGAHPAPYWSRTTSTFGSAGGSRASQPSYLA